MKRQVYFLSFLVFCLQMYGCIKKADNANEADRDGKVKATRVEVKRRTAANKQRDKKEPLKTVTLFPNRMKDDSSALPVVGETPGDNADSDVVYVADYMPQYPGGEDAMSKFIAENIRFTTDDCVQGRVIVQFIVEKDGSITHAKILRGLHPALDKEALRIVNSMPKWTLGKINGKAVRVSCTIPIMFRVG